MVREYALRGREKYPEVWEDILQISRKQPDEYTEEDDERMAKLIGIIEANARVQADGGRYFKVTYMDGKVIRGSTIIELCKNIGSDARPSNVHALIKKGRRVMRGQFFGCWFESILYRQIILPDGTVDWMEETSLSEYELEIKERIVGNKNGGKRKVSAGCDYNKSQKGRTNCR